jgi:glycerol-3-phosphate dehydrogenase
MAEDTVDKAIELGKIAKRKCVTRKLKVHGWRSNPNLADHMYVYGSDEPAILQMINENPALGERLSEKYGYTVAEVLWAVREEMAQTVEDVLARRVRLLFVDAREAQKAARRVAEVMAEEMGKDKAWIESQVEAFVKVSNNYIVC